MTEGMNVKDYDYDLPEELIAQDPLEDRSSSRLMVLDRQTGGRGTPAFYGYSGISSPG